MSDRVLIEHGTKLSELKPQNVIGAAKADLKLIDEKQTRGQWADQDKPYTFTRQHVRRSRGHLVLLLALAYCEDRPDTDKRSTMIIYHHRDLLRRTLISVLEQEGL